MADWYYVDADGKQVGPVAVEELRAAVRRGAANEASLAWRDGLAGWLPISQLATELGLDTGSAATTVLPASPPARSADETNPYRAPEAETGEELYAGSGDVVYAGFWRRWAALFLDQMIIGIPLWIVLFVLTFMVTAAGGGEPNPGMVIVLQLGFYAVWIAASFFYFVMQESSEAQATFGKRALGIKVTDLEGRRISFKHAAGRWLGAAISYMSMYIGFAMAGFTQRKQALHDLIASTLVVDRWAFTRNTERQQRGLGGCAIVFIVFVAGSLLLIPIFFAVAISQYQNYLDRAKNAGNGYVEPEARMVCVAPASSTYVARCLPPSFEA